MSRLYTTDTDHPRSHFLAAKRDIFVISLLYIIIQLKWLREHACALDLIFFHTCCADKGVCEWFQCNDLHVVILTRPACTV